MKSISGLALALAVLVVSGCEKAAPATTPTVTGQAVDKTAGGVDAAVAAPENADTEAMSMTLPATAEEAMARRNRNN